MFGYARSRRGFTLVEVVVALAVLGGAIAVSMEGYSATLRAQKATVDHLQAVVLADERLDALALVPPDSVAWYGTERGSGWDPPLDRFRWRAILTASVDSPLLVRARVVVSWEGGEYGVATIYHRRDLDPDPH